MCLLHIYYTMVIVIHGDTCVQNSSLGHTSDTEMSQSTETLHAAKYVGNRRDSREQYHPFTPGCILIKMHCEFAY